MCLYDVGVDQAKDTARQAQSFMPGETCVGWNHEQLTRSLFSDMIGVWARVNHSAVSIKGMTFTWMN